MSNNFIINISLSISTLGIIVFNFILAIDNCKIQSQLVDNTKILNEINQVRSNKIENAYKIRILKNHHGETFHKYLDEYGNLRCQYIVSPNTNCPIDLYNLEALNFEKLNGSSSVFAFMTSFFYPSGYFRSVENDVVHFGSSSNHPYFGSQYYGKQFYKINDKIFEWNKDHKFIIDSCDSIKVNWYAIGLNNQGELDTFSRTKIIKNAL